MSFQLKPRDAADNDVVGFGTNAVDHLICVPRYPEFNSKLEIDSHLVSAGGEVASTLVGLQRLGSRTAYVGSFGDDSEGALGLRSLREEGVDTTRCRIIPGAETQIAYILIDASSGERTVLWKRDPALAFSESEAPTEVVATARILHLTAHDAAACIRMAERARSAGTLVSVDIDKLFNGVKELLTLVDICITTAEFTEELSGQSGPSGLAKMAEDFDLPVAGVTLGDAGSLFFFERRFVETSAFPVPGGCADTTGAGDAFRAGFLHGVLNGTEVENCAVMANAVAALKCRRMGARAGLPDRETLRQFLDEHGHRSIGI